MKLRKVAFWFVTVIIVALVSPFAAMLWEGFALQHGYDNGTPGLIVAQERFPEKASPDWLKQ